MQLRKLAALLVALSPCLFAPSAFAALALSGAPTTAALGQVSSGTISFTPGAIGDVIIELVDLENTSAQGVKTVSSVSDGVDTYTRLGSPVSFTFDTAVHDVEIWYTIASTAGARTITVTASGTLDHGTLQTIGVSGAASGVPWDGGITSAINTSGTTSVPSVSLSTNNLDTFVIGFCVTGSATGFNTSQTLGGSFTYINTVTASTGGSYYATSGSEYQIFSTKQTGLSVLFGTAWNYWGIVSAALTSDAAATTLHNRLLLGVGQ